MSEASDGGRQNVVVTAVNAVVESSSTVVPASRAAYRHVGSKGNRRRRLELKYESVMGAF